MNKKTLMVILILAIAIIIGLLIASSGIISDYGTTILG